jgi:uncharacterized glyoxalase superfamily protein PhnB
MFPRLIVNDPDQASTFYRNALDATEAFRGPSLDDGRPVVVDLRIGDSSLRVSPAVSEWGWLAPDEIGGCAVLLEIEANDPDVIGESMVTHGAETVIPIKNRPYGKRAGRIRDPFGHLWIINGELK